MDTGIQFGCHSIISVPYTHLPGAGPLGTGGAVDDDHRCRAGGGADDGGPADQHPRRHGQDAVRALAIGGNMELTAIVGLAIVAVCIVVLLRQYKPEYALMLSLIHI